MALTQARSSSFGSVRSTHTGAAFSRSARVSIGTWFRRPFCKTNTLIMRVFGEEKWDVAPAALSAPRAQISASVPAKRLPRPHRPQLFSAVQPLFQLLSDHLVERRVRGGRRTRCGICLHALLGRLDPFRFVDL